MDNITVALKINKITVVSQNTENGTIMPAKWYQYLYHAIENTANQNTGKPLYIRRYSIQPSHRALRSYSRRNLVSVFSMAWYKIVTQHFLVVYYGISHLSLVFSWYTHSPKGSCAYTEKIQVTRGIFHSIPLESVA